MEIDEHREEVLNTDKKGVQGLRKIPFFFFEDEVMPFYDPIYDQHFFF